MYQTTLNKPFSIKGVGLHNGKNIDVDVTPAEENTGIRFMRTDVLNCPAVRTTPFNVSSTQLATTVSCGDFPISTIEHLASALYGLGVDNALIKVNGTEIPILDGSALPIVNSICSAGIRKLNAKRLYMYIEKPLLLDMDDKSIEITPSDDFQIIYEIQYENVGIGSQKSELKLTPENYCKTIACARTFGFQKDVDLLKQLGLIKGGSVENAVVLSETGDILNEGGLRSKEEFVLHKVLDIIGDLSLLGYRVLGSLYAKRAGHSLNNFFARKLLDSPNVYVITELKSEAVGYGYIK
jgi:UDP-3-O-[3-hydroxymyristoyl] N-acetylglucosamine deacetylase